jgi:predicted dehydrogenase
MAAFRFSTLIAFVLLIAFSFSAPAQEKVFRLGIIGLDTSHSPAFAKEINAKTAEYGCKVVAAFPGGSPDIASSRDRIEGFTKQVSEFGVEIVGSIPELLKKVDGVLLESVDGRPHLAQVKPVIAAKKPVFIDKPMAASLEDVIEIFRLARAAGVPCWSASSLRFSPGIAGMRNNAEIGDVLGCDAWSPATLEEHHPDLYWYGIHGVETLYTIMGPGCETVRRVQVKDCEHVVGIWKDGRIGTFRGLRAGAHDYGAFVYGSKGKGQSGPYAGFTPFLAEVVKFFKTGQPPVPEDVTIEIYAFMSAADESKKKDGAAVSVREVIEKARKR